MKQFEKMPLTISRVKRHVGQQRIYRKVSCGRGRKRVAWATALLDDLLSDFDRQRKAGLKLYRTILKTICLGVLRDGKEGVYGLTMIVPGSSSTMASKITPGFINRFTGSAGIVVRKQTGKLQCSVEKRIHMENVAPRSAQPVSGVPARR
jgi:hypothetical protein